MTDKEIAEAQEYIERGRAAWCMITQRATDAERESVRPHLSEICAYLGTLLLS